jgi:hypothetical protein
MDLMFSKRVRRSLLMFLVLALCVFPGLAHAGAFDPAGQQTVPLLSRVQEQVQSWADLLWSSLSGLWEKGGPGLDPHGGEGGTTTGGTGGSTTPPSGTTSGEEGVSIDPNGTP